MYIGVVEMRLSIGKKGLTFVVHLVQSEDSLYACLDVYTISYSTTIWIVYLAVTKI